ncbi:MAG TPA: winged helix-turn-helix transcriptional regulator [Anaerolineales bacterium]|nr:winged helix-turn-helix transcriptional regulator [Anaerolineales bacterium]
MEPSAEDFRDLNLLEHIEANPDITQASLADQLGVAVGTVNWHIKRLVDKGYVKVKRAQRKKLRYIITPSGIAFRARLTFRYIEWSLVLYRKTRKRVGELLDELKEAGYSQVRIQVLDQGPDDIMDICRLTCLEQGIDVVEAPNFPVLEVRGPKVNLHLGEEKSNYSR